VHLHDTCPVQGKDCFNCGIEGHFGRVCRKKKEAPVDGTDTVRLPMETLDPGNGRRPRVVDQPAVSFRDVAAKGRVSSTSVWPPLETRVWRPGMVLADDQFKSCHESPLLELSGRRDTDSSQAGGISINVPHSRSLNVCGTPGGEPSGVGEAISSSRTGLNHGAEDQSWAQSVDCYKCLVSTHFSRR
jgi:hypothetical protein